MLNFFVFLMNINTQRATIKNDFRFLKCAHRYTKYIIVMRTNIT